MTHLPFAVQVFAWCFSVGFITLLILLFVSATWRIGRPEFIWFNMWVGFSWDQSNRILYVAPLPCFVFIYRFPKHQNNLIIIDPVSTIDVVNESQLGDGLIKYDYEVVEEDKVAQIMFEYTKQ